MVIRCVSDRSYGINQTFLVLGSCAASLKRKQVSSHNHTV